MSNPGTNPAPAAHRSRGAFLALATCLLMTLNCGVSAAAAPDLPQASAVQCIDAAKSTATVVERPVDGFSAEGTRATGYFAKGQLVKVEVVALGERGRVLLDFYWQGSTLIAARERTIDYGRMITEIPVDQPLPTQPTQDDAFEFTKGKTTPTAWISNGKAQDAKSKAAHGAAGELLGKARSFRRLMLAKNPAKADECRWACTGDWGGECKGFRCK